MRNWALDMATDGHRCPFWVESRDRRCGKTELIDGRWCKRHTTIMLRRIEQRAEQEAKQNVVKREHLRAKLPGWREQLTRLDAQIARKDPPPATDDLAAFTGVSNSYGARYKARYSADFVMEMAELTRRREQLARSIEQAEHAAAWLRDRADGIDQGGQP